MANRRMFSLKIVDTDAFLDMPPTSQLLYFHLAMRADDDGFVSNPKKIMRAIGSNDDDLKVLLAKSFIIPFESGVCVIKHWRINNYIQNDRYSPTGYLKEKKQLKIKENGSYSLKEGKDVYTLDTQVRLGKVSIGKDKRSPFIKRNDDGTTRGGAELVGIGNSPAQEPIEGSPEWVKKHCQ